MNISLSPLPLYEAAFRKSMPNLMVKAALQCDDDWLVTPNEKIPIKGRINILAFGKASILMYMAAREICWNTGHFGSGLLITHQQDQDQELGLDISCEMLLYSTHPFISDLSFKAGHAAKAFVESHHEEDILIALVSGGGSAMMALPTPGLNLDDKIHFISTVMLLGVPEREVNVLKKSLSEIKGGKLAAAARDKCIVNYILSDERNHQLCAISSGMTVCNEEIDPIAIMDRYGLWEHAPENIAEMIRLHGRKVKVGCQSEIYNHLVGSREDLIGVISEEASGFGYDSVLVLENLHSCTPEEAVDSLVEEYHKAYANAPAGRHLVLCTGEVQVKVELTNKVKGGRNQHLTALMMLAANFSFPFSFAAVATDGMDYLEGIHGAWFDSTFTETINEQTAFIQQRIENTETYHVHKLLGTLLEGGKTGTNMSDFFLLSFEKTSGCAKVK